MAYCRNSMDGSPVKQPSVQLDGDESPSPVRTPLARKNITTSSRGPLGLLRRYETFLDQKLGIEAQGAERVLPSERRPPSDWVMAAMWASATMNLSCFATGFLGWQFGLDLKQSILIIIFGSLLGASVPGWCATLGAPTGLRQVSIARYSMGWVPSKLIAVLNIISQLGWSAVGCITGGQALTAVSNGRVSLALGVVLVAIIGLVISFVGLRAVYRYEQFAWMVFGVIFLVMYGMAAPKADIQTQTELGGKTLTGTVLSLLGVVYGSSASWCGIVSDYYVQFPVDTSRYKVFVLTTLGIALPTSLGMVLGACVASGIPQQEGWQEAYDMGIGYLIKTVLFPPRFADFILVLLVLSGIGTNCMSIYSAALSIQQFARPLSLIPRSLWTLPVFAGILLLGLVGRDQLAVFLQNFLSLLGYWNTVFFAILYAEHYIFRGGSIKNYDLTGWNEPRRLPLGLAGGFAFAVGVAAFVVSMQQTWFTGPLISPAFGGVGDLGNELALGFTLLAYLPARWAERRFVGR